MAWVEHRGRQFRVYEQVAGKRVGEPFATGEDAELFRHVAGLRAWRAAIALVGQEGDEQPQSPAAATESSPPHPPAGPLTGGGGGGIWVTPAPVRV